MHPRTPELLSSNRQECVWHDTCTFLSMFVPSMVGKLVQRLLQAALRRQRTTVWEVVDTLEDEQLRPIEIRFRAMTNQRPVMTWGGGQRDEERGREDILCRSQRMRSMPQGQVEHHQNRDSWNRTPMVLNENRLTVPPTQMRTERVMMPFGFASLSSIGGVGPMLMWLPSRSMLNLNFST